MGAQAQLVDVMSSILWVMAYSLPGVGLILLVYSLFFPNWEYWVFGFWPLAALAVQYRQVR
jgi:hypothetical protein